MRGAGRSGPEPPRPPSICCCSACFVVRREPGAGPGTGLAPERGGRQAGERWALGTECDRRDLRGEAGCEGSNLYLSHLCRSDCGRESAAARSEEGIRITAPPRTLRPLSSKATPHPSLMGETQILPLNCPGSEGGSRPLASPQLNVGQRDWPPSLRGEAALSPSGPYEQCGRTQDTSGRHRGRGVRGLRAAAPQRGFPRGPSSPSAPALLGPPSSDGQWALSFPKKWACLPEAQPVRSSFALVPMG